jgi:peptidoglycan LD-endopeptidase CwlK
MQFAAALTALEIELHKHAEMRALKFYEGWRSPVRQCDLYARGRLVRPIGQTVTRARAWESLHQYGLAADYVGSTGGSWIWWPSADPRWGKFHEVARFCGLEPLSFEKPHVQLAGVKIDDLRRGAYPPGGGDGWEECITQAIAEWGPSSRTDRYGMVHPGAPPPPEGRPPLEAA